jgi:Ca2+-binding RTX toxin-like protein
VLRVNGSYNDDRIRIWRSQRMPDKLIVEYNGNERSFLFSDIARISVDLQDGNDYFQILEGEGQVIRTRTSILGGDGSDTIIGGSGRDTIIGGNSGDLIYGRGNADVILAGGGRDRGNAGAGDDQVSGGSGIDQVVGGSGVDVLFGQNAVEKAFGQDTEGDDWDEDVLLSI